MMGCVWSHAFDFGVVGVIWISGLQPLLCVFAGGMNFIPNFGFGSWV